MATVVVVGGGYGGAPAAKALDEIADVVLVEPKDAFVHNIAALRGLVDPDWTDRIFYPYDRLLSRGRVVHDRAVRVDADAVILGSGERIEADYIVLASGSAYPFPAKMDAHDSNTAKSQIANTRAELIKAERVLLLGAGPVGLELSGEIKAAWPDKAVTIIDPIDDVLSGQYSDAMRKDLRRQLEDLGVNLLLGTSLTAEPRTPPGVTSAFTAVTTRGDEISADIWFRCYGVVPNSDYLSEELAKARLANGHLEVTPELTPGRPRDRVRHWGPHGHPRGQAWRCRRPTHRSRRRQHSGPHRGRQRFGQLPPGAPTHPAAAWPERRGVAATRSIRLRRAGGDRADQGSAHVRRSVRRAVQPQRH